MKEYHLLLRRSWLYDIQPIYYCFKYTYSFKVNGKRIILALLNLVLDLTPSKEEGKTLITHNECQQELEEGKIEVALINNDEIKENIDTRVP